MRQVQRLCQILSAHLRQKLLRGHVIDHLLIRAQSLLDFQIVRDRPAPVRVIKRLRAHERLHDELPRQNIKPAVFMQRVPAENVLR